MSDAQKLKVFISWSGALSKGVALALRDWLPVVFDNVAPWASDKDIEPGQRGLNEIEQQLKGSSFGLIIVTQENQHSPWLNFEAGALSKTVDDAVQSRVVPLLVDIESPAQVTGPISQFQMKPFNEEGLGAVLASIGSLVGVSPEVTATRLDRNYYDLDAVIKSVRIDSYDLDAEPVRSQEDILDEILTLSRSIQANMRSPRFLEARPSQDAILKNIKQLETRLRDNIARLFKYDPVRIEVLNPGTLAQGVLIVMPNGFPVKHADTLVNEVTAVANMSVTVQIED